MWIRRIYWVLGAKISHGEPVINEPAEQFLDSRSLDAVKMIASYYEEMAERRGIKSPAVGAASFPQTGKVIGLHYTGYQSGHAPYKGEYNAAIPTDRIRNLVNDNRGQLPSDLLSIFSIGN